MRISLLFLLYCLCFQAAVVWSQDIDPDNLPSEAPVPIEPTQAPKPARDSGAVSQATAASDEDRLASDPRVLEALTQLRNGAVNQGIKTLLDLTSEGSAEASFHLGEIYNLGIGRDRDVRIALMYYRLAGRSGIKRADLTRANLLYFEVQDPASIAEAAELYKTYALQDVSEALYVLGLLYWNGDVTGESDPVRGYGLVRRAKEKFYGPAIQAEHEMAKQLSFEARDAGRIYGETLREKGFGDDDFPLAIELVLDGVAPSGVSSAGLPSDWDKDDWAKVWRVEVGFANSLKAGQQLNINIQERVGRSIPNLQYQVVEDSFRAGRYRVVFGPLANLQEAIDKCFMFKREGFDCFSRAPL